MTANLPPSKPDQPANERGERLDQPSQRHQPTPIPQGKSAQLPVASRPRRNAVDVNDSAIRPFHGRRHRRKNRRWLQGPHRPAHVRRPNPGRQSPAQRHAGRARRRRPPLRPDGPHRSRRRRTHRHGALAHERRTRRRQNHHPAWSHADPHFPALRSPHELSQRPSPQKQIPSSWPPTSAATSTSTRNSSCSARTSSG